MSRKRKKVISENTFLLALDGDVDFQPSAVQLLVDRMKKNPKLGATCGRPMVWYQKFEYAISHWLQKATEHTLGCVLCSPGCFSLFRGYALMDDNVMRRYTTPPSEPSHYVQYDQGEDRWLCTLLLQQGYRVEYVAASDALTYAPEGFNEFYNQRRRWSPSTMANILDLLMDWKNVRRKNDDISLPYIGYQMFLMVSSILTPGTIFLMILGALTTGFPGIQPWTALLVNLVPVVIFVLMCFVAKPDVQLTYAAILSVIYSLVMMVVLVGLLREAATAGFCSVTTIFLCFVAGEFFCIIHGFLYFLSIPSMSMLLMIYSLGNLHVVSWGTRETTQPTTSATQQKVSQKKGMVQGWLERFGMAEVGAKQDSDYNFSCGNLFRCMCCPQQSSSNHDNHLAVILERLNDIEERMTEYTRSQVSRNLSAGSSVINETQVEDHKPFSQNALLFEGEGERANPLFQEEKQKKRDELKDPYWIHDEDIKSGATVYLPNDEVDFWNQFIGDYLFPIVEDKKQKKEIEKGLLELRNKVCLAFLLINAMFVTIVYALTQINVSDNNSLSVPLWCKSGKGDGHKQATVEPISFAFTAVFGILLLIQFICMLFHRTATLLHILASTEIGVKKRFDKMRKSPEEADDIADITVADGLKLVRDMQASNDDDSDTKSVMSIATTIASEDDAGDTIETKNKSDLWKKIARRRKELGHNTLSKNFLKNFSKLHQTMTQALEECQGAKKENEAEDNIKKVQNKFGKRFQRQSLYTIVNMAKNPHLKQRISERAERVSRWKDLQKKLIPNPAQKGFAGIAKLALQKDKEEKIKQQQQQQTVDEQKEQPKVTTEVDINPQLPDRGEEWPEEDNYAIAGGDYEEIDDIKTKDLNNSDVLF
ncbi:hypothetical protein KUTeg_002191 [Tegillarca granosa]|uniref:chitin synthase n=1 Tax=Tegillarca granosa TaxID=220873 RepID=A0ABQ9FTM1_TEGGR|nr:hypothetical protein KUTeg_002191 [Tegillarca granosa]